MALLEPGAKAPDFTTIDQSGNKVTLRDYRGKKVVLYFYPKDDTPGCTKEACAFRDSFESFKELGVEILGVSVDNEKSHKSFVEKFKLPFKLLADTDKKIVTAYGVWGEKSMYGRKYMGMERATFLIDGNGVIQGIWRKVKVPGHVEEVLKAVKAL